MNTDTVINYIKNNNHNRMNLQSLFECFSGDLITLGSVFRCREVLDGTRLTFGTVDGNLVKICVKVRLQVYPGYATETGWEAIFLPWRYERNRKIECSVQLFNEGVVSLRRQTPHSIHRGNFGVCRGPVSTRSFVIIQNPCCFTTYKNGELPTPLVQGVEGVGGIRIRILLFSVPSVGHWENHRPVWYSLDPSRSPLKPPHPLAHPLCSYRFFVLTIVVINRFCFVCFVVWTVRSLMK